ncbi:ferrichrome ABC transporter permease [Tumebacillus algifaecis]|uniref:Ferrichrome ABC transporter permease n=1 Tax=Tumebacillus algifaecis TaxID=1214604 RepID=A0A223D633_9BACL|nr:iron ABC transporter permease [Tumebacillus algifaecis]ASS77059.1 ferrichrome ABC transporter permease [Tumebacillus algifaecis]
MKFQSRMRMFVMLIAPIAALLLVVASILYGAKQITATTVWESLFWFDASNVDHQIIWSSRLPRAVGAILIGCFLAVSGALMQGMTRNYLASPSMMGVSDGSVFVITLLMVFVPSAHSTQLILFSMLGSALGAGLVFGIAWLIPNGMSPVRLAILGIIIGTFLSGVADAVATYFQISQSVSFWYNARLHQMDPALIKLSIPFAFVGLMLALVASRSLLVLSFGEDVAASLGQRTWIVKAVTILAVVILTGVSVALAGKIAFVGLIIPHIARFLVGVDHRWTVPVSGVLGGLFLPLCDIIARFLNHPFETPIGVVTALFGVPFFLYLIKTRGGGKHA